MIDTGRNYVECDGTETVAVVDDIVYIFGHDPECGWFVINDGELEPFYSGRVAAAHFRQIVDTAMLIYQHRRREEPEPPFVLGACRLEAADYLPV